MSLARSVSLAAFLAGSTLGTTALADEPISQETKRACVRANEEGQDLRREGRLLEARAYFASCSTASCPNVLRQDCVARRDEVQRAIPVVRFIVTDSRGTALSNASIKVDDVEALRCPDDSIEMNPGDHAFVVGAPGHDLATGRLAVREGDGRRNETIVLKSSDGRAARGSIGNRYRGFAYGLGGVGIALVGVGTYFGLAAKSTYDDASSGANCPRGPTSCNDAALEQVKRADDQAAISTVMFLVGGLLVGGGVVLYVVAPKRRAVSVAPAFGVSSAALEARMSF